MSELLDNQRPRKCAFVSYTPVRFTVELGLMVGGADYCQYEAEVGSKYCSLHKGSAPRQPTEESGVLSYDDGVVSVGGLICDIEQLEASRLGASEPRPQGVSLGETREEKPDVLSYPEEGK